MLDKYSRKQEFQVKKALTLYAVRANHTPLSGPKNPLIQEDTYAVPLNAQFLLDDLRR